MKNDEEVVRYKRDLHNNSSMDDCYFNGWGTII